MRSFKELLEVADILNSEGGCPWDLEQTFESLRPYILEEAHEALEAIDKGNDKEMIEELGDLMYTVIFYSKVAEREGRFSIHEIVQTLKEKLVRRHPHVFGEKKVDSIEDVMKTWESVKREEKKERKSALDGIPKTLPSLLKAQKVLKKIEKTGAPQFEADPQSEDEEIAEEVLSLVKRATSKGVDLESAFRKRLSQEAEQFQKWELHRSEN